MKEVPQRPTKHRWKRSFIKRQGHVTTAQKRAIRRHWPDLGLTFRYGERLDLEQAFGRSAPTTIEVGFGMGEALVAMAASNPERDYLGIEVHRPGLGAALMKIAELGLTNVRLVRGDALLVLSDVLIGPICDALCVFFPDPWPRPKDIGRRLVNPPLMEVLAERMRPGGELHLATDIEGYAQHMMAVVSDRPEWANPHGPGCFAPRPPWRPHTKYELKATAEGRDTWDLSFRLSATLL